MIADDLAARVDEEKAINFKEDARHRQLAQINASLKAKLEFITSKYDFTSNVNILNSDDFKTLVVSNNMVSYFSINLCSR